MVFDLGSGEAGEGRAGFIPFKGGGELRTILKGTKNETEDEDVPGSRRLVQHVRGAIVRDVGGDGREGVMGFV